MKTLFPVVLSVVILLALLAIPLYAVDLTAAFGTTEQLLSLLRLYLMTCAFVGALWALYLKDTRIRANSDNILVSLVVFVVASCFVVVAILLNQLASPTPPAETASTPVDWAKWARFLAFISIEILLAAFITLLFTVFLQTYNQLYNLRTNKVLKYFKPVRWLRRTLGRHKYYEYEMLPRELDAAPGMLKDLITSPNDINALRRGATALIVGQSCDELVTHVLRCMHERMTHQETANFVVADRHPIDIWKKLEGIDKIEDPLRDSLVLIDCYTPSFGFTDDIHEHNDNKLRNNGVAVVKAKTFAGLHTANNAAFNIIKSHEQKQQKNVRRPMVMVYANVSALCDFESFEQFRVFWRHVIPSERSYGMLTLILEDASAGDEVLCPLRQLADFEIEVKRADGSLKFERKK